VIGVVPVLILGVVSTVLLPVLKTEQSAIAVAKISASVTLYNAKHELHSAPPARIVEHAQIRFVLQDPTTSRIPPHSGSQMERALSTGGDPPDVVTVECAIVVDCVDVIDPGEYPSAEQLVIPDPRREASVILRGTQQSLQTGPAASRVGQKHASSEQDEAADPMRPHSVVHSEAGIVVDSLGIVEFVLDVDVADPGEYPSAEQLVIPDPMREASVILRGTQQSLQTGPAANRVGQKHASSEQDEAADPMRPHSVVHSEAAIVVDALDIVDVADPGEYPSAEQLVIPDPMREASVMLRGTQQSLQTGPAASRVGQKHASSEQDEAADAMSAHSVVHSEAAIVVVPVAPDVVEVVCPEVELGKSVVEDGPDDVDCGQAVASNSEIVAASVGSPELAKQALHAEPLADKVGQRHSSFEQAVAAM